jgi:integrase
MNRRTGRVPAYRLHRPSGQARVIINGRHIYLGKFGSPESHEEYARRIAGLSTDSPSTESDSAPNNVSSLSVNALLLRYWEFAESTYIKDGKPTRELANMADAIWPLRTIFGSLPADQFGPRKLKLVRQQMINDGLSRNVINSRIGRIKRVFKWAVGEELLPSSVFHALQAVSGLRFGRTKARETEPVRPVQDLYVAVLLPLVPPQIAAMIKLQRLTGMRPCEVVRMRPCDIDTTDDVWVYEPFDHKNKWRGHEKRIPLGPTAQEILEPFLKRDPKAFLFSPKEADAWRLETRQLFSTTERKTPVFPCEMKARARRKQERKKRTRRRQRREHYDTNSYRLAIEYAFKKAGKFGFVVPHWHPNQLRHTRATEVRRQFGIEAAQVALGHSRADVTQIYAERNLDSAAGRGQVDRHKYSVRRPGGAGEVDGNQYRVPWKPVYAFSSVIKIGQPQAAVRKSSSTG